MAAKPKSAGTGWLDQNYNALGMGLSLLGGISQASAAEAQGDYQNTMSQINASFADRQAEDAIKRSIKDSGDVKKTASELAGEQRVAFAAQGTDVNSGTAADVQLGTEYQGIEAAKTVRNNAIREALGFKTQALDSRNQGAMGKIAARNSATNSILTSGLQGLSMFRKGVS